MRLIVVSVAPWNINNNFGKVFDDLFSGMDDIEFLNIYCASGTPNNHVRSDYFQITFRDLVKNLFNPSFQVGRIVECNEDACELNEKEAYRYSLIKAHPLRVFLWGRRFIWWIGRWNSSQLNNIIEDFHADIVFIPAFKETYMNSIQQYVLKKANVKAVAYYGDDLYSLKIVSINPFFWMDRLWQRHLVKQTLEMCEYIYVVSDIMKEECVKEFNKKCIICTHGEDFSLDPDPKVKYRKEKKLVYAGNLGNHRWEEIIRIGVALDRINEGHILYVYSGTPLPQRIINRFNTIKSIKYKGKIPANEVPDVLNDADVLVHVESFRLKERCLVHQSFSTKLIGYCVACRPLFLVGTRNTGCIDHFARYDSAIIASSKSEVEKKLRDYLNNDDELKRYALKAYNCGKQYHDKGRIQKMMREDFLKYLGVGHESVND